MARGAPGGLLTVRLALPAGLGESPGALPNVQAAVAALARYGHARWLAYAQGEPLPGGGRMTPRTGSYLRSIQLRATGPASYRVLSDAPHAAALETGVGERDMKRMLDSSIKVRRTKDGRRYLIIPFRWGTGTGSGGGVSFGRQVMPSDIYEDLARHLEPSRITGHGRRVSGTGAWSPRTRAPLTVRQRAYHWGGRLTATALVEAGASDRHVRRLQGMVRMQRKDGKHTTYMTFRTMVEGGRGWVSPARPGLYPARTASQDVERKAGEVLRRALQADVSNLL